MNLQFQLPFVPFPLEYELFVGVAAVGELVAIVATVVILASAFDASCIVASCIDASCVGVVEQPQQGLGGGTAVEQLVEVVAGAMDTVAVGCHLAVAVEAFVKGKVLQPHFCRRFYRRHCRENCSCCCYCCCCRRFLPPCLPRPHCCWCNRLENLI